MGLAILCLSPLAALPELRAPAPTLGFSESPDAVLDLSILLLAAAVVVVRGFRQRARQAVAAVAVGRAGLSGSARHRCAGSRDRSGRRPYTVVVGGTGSCTQDWEQASREPDA